ncbi:unnamed protein product [Blepharisma stoltei]|uniref:Uncharacterized protein n=1 Tax=Blepharisma stoltei TaxID=1481888 RepID=A0AAU9IK60_9CILI|nr:unnamed protein product [Blepharisma stoltei]
MRKTQEPFNSLLKGLEGEFKNINYSLSKVQTQLPSHLLPSDFFKLQQQLTSMHQSLKPNENSAVIKLPVLAKTTNSQANLTSNQDYRRPIRSVLSEQRTRSSIINPQNSYGRTWLNNRYNLPEPTKSNFRALGTKKYSKPKVAKYYKAKVLPRQYREDPQSDPPPITEQDVEDGMMNLITRGLIPKDVDLSPAFERGVPPLKMQTAAIHDWRDKAPPAPTISSSNMQLAIYEPKINDQSRPLFTLESPGEIQEIAQQEKPAIKNYEEIVDTYSQHQITIRKGKILVTPEFLSFKRIYSEVWSNIAEALQMAEEIFGKYGAGIVYLDGKKLADLAKDELRTLKEHEIISCIINAKSVVPFIQNPNIKYKTPLGKDLACVKIQSAWRGYKAFVAYQQLKILIEKANIIKKGFKNYMIKKREKRESTEESNN